DAAHSRSHDDAADVEGAHVAPRARWLRRQCAGRGESALTAATVRRPRRQCAGRDDTPRIPSWTHDHRAHHTLKADVAHSKQTSHTHPVTDRWRRARTA